MPKQISLYLQDETLRKLDEEVARRVAKERAQGLSGHKLTSRSNLIDELINKSLGKSRVPTVQNIQYTIVQLAEEYGAKKVSLFGSIARGDATEDSDVDILLEKGDMRGLQVLDFEAELAKRLGRHVDIVTTAGATERFLNRIKKDEVVIYESA